MTDGFKLLIEHNDECWVRADDLAFIVQDGTDWHRDRLGRKGGSTAWQRFRCNDPDCPAVALVRWDVLGRFVTAGVSPVEEKVLVR